MKPLDAYVVLNELDEDLVLDAIPPAWGAGGVAPKRRRDGDSAYGRFMRSPMAAAVLSVIASAAVLSGMIALGRHASTTPGAAITESGEDTVLTLESEEATAVEVNPCLAKIQLPGVSEDTLIQTVEELSEKLEALKEKGTEVEIMIQLVDDIDSDPEYIRISNKRDEIKTTEDAHAWRAELVEYTTAYFEKIHEASADLIESVGFGNLEPMELSPFVFGSCNAKDITCEGLIALAESDKVSYISVETHVSSTEG